MLKATLNRLFHSYPKMKKIHKGRNFSSLKQDGSHFGIISNSSSADFTISSSTTSVSTLLSNFKGLKSAYILASEDNTTLVCYFHRELVCDEILHRLLRISVCGKYGNFSMFSYKYFTEAICTRLGKENVLSGVLSCQVLQPYHESEVISYGRYLLYFVEPLNFIYEACLISSIYTQHIK